MSFIASKAAKKYFAGQAKSYEPPDPYYEMVTDSRGRTKRVKRDVPPGLTKKEAKTLRKIRRRAHYLDKGVNLCGFRVGWTFFIGIIPGVGDITDAALNYGMVVKPARTLDISSQLLSQMLFNNAVSAGVGLVPLVGDVALAAWKANWRNANALEAFLKKRGEENLRKAEENNQQFQGEAQAEVQQQANADHNEQAVLATDPDGYGTVATPVKGDRRPAPSAPARK